jgi:hypothetical protein
MKLFFISSTYRDLINERDKAIDTIDSLDSSKAIAMERISSNPNPPKDVCLAKLRNCDTLILILGTKYGSIDPEEKISLTEIEYNEARFLHLPIFVFRKVNAEDEWIPDEKNAGTRKKLENFKKSLDIEHYRTTFQTSEELARKIAIAIYNYESDNGEIGIRNPQFATGEIFFKTSLDTQKIFNHCHPFFGRSEILKTTGAFIGSEKSILILHGRGGIGKSKLIYEIYKEYSNNQDIKFWFLRENSQLLAESFRQIPLKKKNIIVVDDAHRFSNLKLLIQLAFEHQQNIQIIFSLRNYGMDFLKFQIFESGFNPKDIEIPPEITELTRQEMVDLADSILDSSHKEFSDSLVHVARDSPLVLVIGARLINENNLPPALLERNQDFQDIVFSRFRDIQMGNLNPAIDENAAKKILNLISALQPVNLGDSTLMDKISENLKIERINLISIIDDLQRSGVLLNRRNFVRITPDVFSDYLLSKACISNGRLTGYAEDVFEKFFGHCPNEIISNIAELDWRIQSDGSKIDVMNQIWDEIFDAYANGSNLIRNFLLVAVDKIAYLQPSRSMDLVEYALMNPSLKNENLSGFHEYTHEDIKRVICPILQKISYNLNFVSQCADMLWDLGKDQPGLPSSETTHPIRILQDLAAYGYHKPLIIQEKILDSVKTWMRNPSVHDHLFSPLDIIDPILRKDGEDSRLRGKTIQITPFAVSYQNTRKVRKKVIELISSAMNNKSTRIVLRSLISLTEALHPPRALYGRTISDKEYARWRPEEQKILKIIEKKFMESQDPVVQIIIIQQIRWYLKFQKDETNRKTCQRIITRRKNTFKIRLIRTILNSFDDEDNRDYSKQQKIIEQKIQRTVEEFNSKFSSADDGYTILADQIQILHNEKISINPGRFFYLLGKKFPDFGEKICLKILTNESSVLEMYYSAILSGIKETDPKVGQNLIALGLKSPKNLIIQSIAFGYSNGWWSAGVEKEELENVEILLKIQDDHVKKLAIESLAEFSCYDSQKIKKIVLSTDIGNNNVLANSLFKPFFSTTIRQRIELTRSETHKLLTKLIPLQSLEHRSDGSGFYICNFLKYACEKYPASIIELFFKRIEFAKTANQGVIWNRYHAIPSDSSYYCLEEFWNHKDHLKLLKKVRNAALKLEDIYHLRNLFSIFSNNYEIDFLKFFKDWIETKEEEKLLLICELIYDSPPEILFSNHIFIQKMLEASSGNSGKFYSKIKKKLFDVGRYTARFGTVGEPFAEDVKIKTIAEEKAKEFQKGSYTKEFYLELAEKAKHWMDESILGDSDLFDE